MISLPNFKDVTPPSTSKKMELEFPVMICLNIASLLIEKVLNKFLEELQKIPFHGLMD